MGSPAKIMRSGMSTDAVIESTKGLSDSVCSILLAEMNKKGECLRILPAKTQQSKYKAFSFFFFSTLKIQIYEEFLNF